MKFHGMTVREAARHLGLSESNVKVMAHRAHRALRHHIVESPEAE